MNIKTIKKNSKFLKDLLNNEISARLYTLENYFTAENMSNENFKAWYSKFHRDIKVSQCENTITFRFHSNCWVEVDL